MDPIFSSESETDLEIQTDRARRLFDNLVGARSGIIRRVNLIEPTFDEAPLFHVVFIART